MMPITRGSLAALLVIGLMAGPVAAQPQSIALWAGGVPGASAASGTEQTRLSPQGERIVTGVREPSITPYLPEAGQASGAAVIIAPGGGHKELWMDHEGYRVGEWLSAHGVAAFVLKYRLSEEPNVPYRLEVESLGDIQRAIRVVRSRSAEWGINRDAVGVIGFSAGGELAALAGWRDAVSGGPADPVDRQSVRPSFVALIYPGLPQHGAFSPMTPPTFLLAGDQDRPQVSEGLADLYLAMKRGGASAELHLLAGVGHGFGMREANPPSVQLWPALFYDWLGSKGFLGQPRP